MKQVNQQLLDSVLGTYHMITNELSKPQEDVVEFSVCLATKSGIQNILKLYLESKDVDINHANSIDELVKLAIQQNEKFNRFDFSALNCRCEHSDDHSMSYCLGEEKINSCYRLLVGLKGFIFDELKIKVN